MKKCLNCGKENATHTYQNDYYCEDCFNSHFMICEDCDSTIPIDNIYTTYNNRHICNDCFNDNYFMCEDCENIYPIDNSYTTYNARLICEDCYDSNYYTCSDCDTVYPIDRSYTTHDDQLICYDCRDDHYTYCEDCDQLFHNDDIHYHEQDDCYYCESCYDRHPEENNILSYHHPIDYNFLGKTSPIYLGTEVEIENTKNIISNDEAAGHIQDMIPVYPMHDGSIDNGFEMVSDPQNIEWTMEHAEDFERAFAYLTDNGFRGDQTTTCGLHIHVSRDPLNDDTVDKILLFMENYKNELISLARRHSTNWSAFISDRNEDFVQSLTYIKDKKHSGNRYMALNLQNIHTIEFRLFRSTLNPHTYLATIQLVASIVHVCNTYPIEEIDFNKVVNAYPYPYLKEYITRRGVDISRPLINIQLPEITREQIKELVSNAFDKYKTFLTGNIKSYDLDRLHGVIWQLLRRLETKSTYYEALKSYVEYYIDNNNLLAQYIVEKIKEMI